MPRIELIPHDYDPKSGDGTPTIDVCSRCAESYEEGEPYNDKKTIGSTDVEHPPYEDDPVSPYHCADCDKVLTDDEDN